jgi:hypothetical protein
LEIEMEKRRDRGSVGREKVGQSKITQKKKEK